MFRRSTGSLTPSAALSAAALAAAGLLAAAPLAHADPAPTDPVPSDAVPIDPVPNDDPAVGVSVLDNLTVLPVQACGVDAGVPILSDVLDPSDAAPDASCAIADHDGVAGSATGTPAATGD